MIVLDEAQVRSLLRMEELIPAMAEAASNFRSRVYRLQSRDGRDHLLKFLICAPSRLSLAPLAVFSFHRIMGWCDLYWS